MHRPMSAVAAVARQLAERLLPRHCWHTRRENPAQRQDRWRQPSLSSRVGGDLVGQSRASCFPRRADLRHHTFAVRHGKGFSCRRQSQVLAQAAVQHLHSDTPHGTEGSDSSQPWKNRSSELPRAIPGAKTGQTQSNTALRRRRFLPPGRDLLQPQSHTRGVRPFHLARETNCYRPRSVSSSESDTAFPTLLPLCGLRFGNGSILGFKHVGLPRRLRRALGVLCLA